MTWYSEIPARRTRQLLGDAWLVLWSALWIWIALRLYDLVMNLAAPGLAVADSATDMSERFTSAGETLSGVPLIGGALQSMARQPLHLLARISDDPAGAWRRGDQAVIAELASLELRSEGLAPRAAVS